MSYAPPIPSSFTTQNAAIIRPDLAQGISPSNAGGSWASGYQPWSQLAPANDLSNHALAYLFLLMSDSLDARPAQLQLQVGTGDAGFEVIRGTFKIVFWGQSTGTYQEVQMYPLLTIPPNARVAVRMASNAGGAALTVKAAFDPLPL